MSRAEAAHWRDFSFLPHWGSLTAAQKLDRLRRHACHELHFFVHQRDPQLFRSAVLPLLQVRSGLSPFYHCTSGHPS